MVVGYKWIRIDWMRMGYIDRRINHDRRERTAGDGVVVATARRL